MIIVIFNLSFKLLFRNYLYNGLYFITRQAIINTKIGGFGELIVVIFYGNLLHSKLTLMHSW